MIGWHTSSAIRFCLNHLEDLCLIIWRIYLTTPGLAIQYPRTWRGVYVHPQRVKTTATYWVHTDTVMGVSEPYLDFPCDNSCRIDSTICSCLNIMCRQKSSLNNICNISGGNSSTSANSLNENKPKFTIYLFRMIFFFTFL